MLFTEEERKIYHCPFTDRDYDPLTVRRALTVETKNAFGRLCDEARDSDPVKAALAQQALTTAARKAFGWEPLKVMDVTVWEALIAFTVYLRGKGTRAASTPETSPSSDGPGLRRTKPGCP
jgi:hypothetical protein